MNKEEIEDYAVHTGIAIPEQVKQAMIDLRNRHRDNAHYQIVLTNAIAWLSFLAKKATEE